MKSKGPYVEAAYGEKTSEYHETLTKNFLLDYPMASVAGLKTVLDDLGTKNPRVREINPQDLIEPRFLRELKATGSSNRESAWI